MYVAVSLKSGENIEAIKASYKATRDLLLVCPECGDPVQFKLRHIPHETPFFAHPKEEESKKLIKGCSLRVEGSHFQKASDVVAGISHGQLVNKFQREFCKELYESLEPTSTALYEFIRDSGFEKLEENHYKSLIDTIQSGCTWDEFVTKKVYSWESVAHSGGLDDVCLFLNSPYGIWVGNFLYQTAYFIACIVHQGTLSSDLGRCIVRYNQTEVIFIVDSNRLKKTPEYAAEILPASSKRNILIPQIASSLVAYLLLKWRLKSQVPSLLAIVDKSFDITETSFESMAETLERPAIFPKILRGTRDNPLCIGTKGTYSDAQMKQLVRKVASRRWSAGGTFSRPIDWVFLSDIPVMVNVSSCEFVDAKSYEIRDGVATLRTTKGTIHIPGHKISWR